MGSSGLAHDGDGYVGVLQGLGYRSAVACSSRFRWNCSGGGHCWDTRLDRLMDVQVCRRCPGQRLRGRCALFSAGCPWDGGEVVTGYRQKAGRPVGRRRLVSSLVRNGFRGPYPVREMNGTAAAP